MASQRPHAEFPLGPFRPYDANPILRPQGDDWESANVYNPAAVVKDGEVVLSTGRTQMTWSRTSVSRPARTVTTSTVDRSRC